MKNSKKLTALARASPYINAEEEDRSMRNSVIVHLHDCSIAIATIL